MKAMLFLVSLFVLAACSSGDSSSGSGSGDAKSRWPEKGSYDISLTYNGCTDSYHFNSKAEYCTALTDENQSRCNTRDQRKERYTSECGNDFSPRNVKSPSVYGWDDYLKIRCEVKSERYPTMKELCASLADESKHAGCFWQQRAQYFVDYKCEGNMSPKPAAPVATPTPVPQPIPVDPNSFESAVAEYKAVGIELKRGIHQGPDFPGDETYYQKFKEFIPVLHAMKQAFADRVSSIKKIDIGDYTNYEASYNDLTLDPSFTTDELQKWMTIHDQRVSLQKSTNIEIDFGIDVYGHEQGDRLKDFRARVNYFASKAKLIQAMAPVVKKMKLNTSDGFSFSSGELALHPEKYNTQLEQLGPFFANLSTLQKSGVEFSGYLMFGGEPQALKDFGDFVQANSNDFITLSVLVGGLKIELKDGYDTSPSYAKYSKQLSIQIKSRFESKGGLGALISIVPTLNELAVPFEVSGYDLDEKFVNGTKLLLQRKSAILKKRDKIKAISFSPYDSDYSEYSGLTIGGGAKIDSLDKALAKIPR